MPPPTWTGIATAFRSRRITSLFWRTPSRAPSRSTTCSRCAPSASQRRAISAGSSPYRVSREKSPCTSRTQRPSRMSTAGIGVNMRFRGDAPEVSVKSQTHVGALFGVELGGHHVVVRDNRREVEAVLRGCHCQGVVLRLGVVPMHEIEVTAVWYSFDDRVMALDRERVPADLRDLQAVLSRETPDGSAQDPKALDSAALFTAIEEQLQAYADPEKRPARGGVRS